MFWPPCLRRRSRTMLLKRWGSRRTAADRTAPSPALQRRPRLTVTPWPLTPVTPTRRPPPRSSSPKSARRRLSELKKQRAASKLLAQPVLNGHLGNGSTKPRPEDPRMPLVSSNGSAVYFTPASGDPPLLRLKQPIEDEDPKSDSCCCVS